MRIRDMRLFKTLTLMTWAMIVLLPIARPGHCDDDDLDRFITASAYPDHDAVVLLSRRTHTFQLYIELETSTTRSLATRTGIKNEKRIKILREGAFDRFGNFESLTYNKDIHEYKLDVRVISPEGKRKKVGKDNIRKIEIADKYFQYRVAFPGLEAGSIIEIEEEIKSEYPILSGIWDFADEVPTIRSELVFKVPKETTTRFDCIPAGAVKVPEPKKDGRYDVYKMTLENVKPYSDEIYMSPEHIGNPTVYYHVWMISNNALASALGIDPGLLSGKPYTMNWKDVVEMLGLYFDPGIWENDEDSSGYRDIISSDIARFRADFDVTEEKLNELLSWFRQEFEAVDDDLFYYSSNPEESFKLRKGGPFELAYVLKYILAELGVTSSVIMVRDADKGLLNRNMPSYSAFNHPLLKVGLRGSEFWIDPYSHFCRVDQLPWQCRGVDAMRLLQGGSGNFMMISLASADNNRIENRQEALLSIEGDLTCTSNITLTGQHLLGLRRSVDEDDIGGFEEAIKERLAEIYPETFDEENFEILENGDNAIKLSYSYSLPAFADVAGEYMNIDFSRWHSSSLASVFTGETREFDIEFPFLRMERTDVTVTLPEGAVVEEIPRPVLLDDKHFSYSRKIYVEGNVIRFERMLKILEPTIAVAEYLTAKEVANKIYLMDGEEVVVKR